MAFVWEQRKLGEVADIVGGGTPSTNVSNYWDGNIDWYAPAEISDQIFLSSSQRKITEKGYNNSSAKMLPIGTVLFTSRAGIGKTAILSKKGCTNQGFQSIVPHKDELDSYFIFSRTDELKRYGEIVGAGSTFVEVSGKQMANIEMMMPKTISEQKVIGAYFAKLDHLITLHQRKRMLRKCFFSIDWEQCKFGELVDKYEDLVETPTDGYMRLGIRSHAKGTFYSYVEKGKELETAKMFRVAANNFIVNITFGWEHAVAITDENDAGKLVSHRFPQYQFHKGMIPKFFKYLILDESFKHHLELSSPGGAGRNRVLKLNDMLNYQMRFPSEQEQKKVANYFDTLDTLITLHQCKSNFCKKNEVNAWEQRKLGKIVEVHNGKDYKHLEKGNIPVYGTGGYMLSVSESLSDTQDAIGIGRKGTIDKPYILRAPFWTVDTLFYCIPREENDLNFIFDIFQNINWRLMDESTGVPSLSKKSINNVKILVPNKKEQKQIGLYFNQLDHLITLHQWECNINENTEGNDEKQRKPIKKLIISEGNLSLVDDMFLLHRMTFLVCNKYILLRLNVVKYKITIIIISNILYSIVSLLIIACYLIVINKQLIILIYVEISVVIIKGDDDYARIRS